jgi:hypothetical protein
MAKPAAASIALMSSVDSIRSRSISSAWGLSHRHPRRGFAYMLVPRRAGFPTRRPRSLESVKFWLYQRESQMRSGTPELSYSHYQIHPAARSRCAATDSGFLHLIHAWHGPER